MVGSMVPQTTPLLAPRGPSQNVAPPNPLSTPPPQAHQRSRPPMPWLLRRLPRCRMLRLFHRLRRLMLLRQEGWMPRPPQHPQLLPHLTSPQREIQSPASDKVPRLPENEFLQLWIFSIVLAVGLYRCAFPGWDLDAWNFHLGIISFSSYIIVIIPLDALTLASHFVLSSLAG